MFDPTNPAPPVISTLMGSLQFFGLKLLPYIKDVKKTPLEVFFSGLLGVIFHKKWIYLFKKGKN
jgi:xanthosine utilization system XapX-like protein